MLKFTAYIEYLLMTRHYCYVPGHGAYMLADEPASFDEIPSLGASSARMQGLNAPQRVVRFSPLHTHDDGILANLLMEAENMTYDEACRYISQQAKTLDEDFLQEALADTDVENFGFEPLRLETWLDIETRLNPPVETVPAVQAEAKTSPDTIAIPKVWLQRAAMVLVICLFYFTNFIGLNTDSTQLASVIDVNALRHNAALLHAFADDDEAILPSEAEPIQTEVVGVNTQPASASATASAITATPSAVTPTASTTTAPTAPAAKAKSTMRYYIIIASTVSEEEALALCRRYNNNGYEHMGILAKQNLFRVYTESFSQKDEALIYLRQLRQVNDKLSKAWMLPLEEESLSYNIKNIYNDNQLSMELSHPNQRTERDQG